MRIGIDARMLGQGFGLARYLQQLVEHLEKTQSSHEYVLFMRKDNWDEFTPSSERVSKVLADIPWYGVKEQVLLAGIIRKQDIDLMHFPHWNVPFFYSGPYVVTIHDLTMFHFPRPEATTHGRVLFFLKDIAHRMLLRRVVKKAKHIITTSEWTKQDIHNTLDVPPGHMTTIYQAPFVQKGKDYSIEKIYKISKPYVLYVGAAYPHKNVEGLLKAWQLYTERYGDDYNLVLAGKDNYFYQRIKKSDLAKQASVRFIGFVPDEDLPMLYKQASVFVFPSLYEGFGLPPLEALSQGTAVLASSASCLPEILGEAALYADPHSPEQWADALHKLLTSEDVRFTLRQQGRIELQRYSWKDHAQKTENIYQEFASLEKNDRR